MDRSVLGFGTCATVAGCIVLLAGGLAGRGLPDGRDLGLLLVATGSVYILLGAAYLLLIPRHDYDAGVLVGAVAHRAPRIALAFATVEAMAFALYVVDGTAAAASVSTPPALGPVVEVLRGTTLWTALTGAVLAIGFLAVLALGWSDGRGSRDRREASESLVRWSTALAILPPIALALRSAGYF